MKLLLDENVIKAVEENNKVFKMFAELKEYGDADINICYSTLEKINQIPDSLREKRIRTLDLLFSLEPKILQDRPVVANQSRFDFSAFDDGNIYNQIIELTDNDICGSIHAQTAVSNGLILVTNNKTLYNSMKRIGCDVFNLSDLENGHNIMSSIYPILKQEYTTGFVCYFDILGFGSFSLNEDNLAYIKQVMSDLQKFIRMNRLNKFIGKITIFSDSVFFTVKDVEMKEVSFFTSILDFVCTARDIIQEHIGTDIRAGISYGKYIHLQSGEVYGPAITQAVKLAEPKKEGDILYSFLDGNPASIIIHQNVFDSSVNKYGELKRLFECQNDRFIEI